jgi:hypothetical protein
MTDLNDDLTARHLFRLYNRARRLSNFGFAVVHAGYRKFIGIFTAAELDPDFAFKIIRHPKMPTIGSMLLIDCELR